MADRRDERDPKAGTNLQALRKARKLTAQKLADASGVPLRTIQDYELGRSQPGWWAMLRLCRALGVTPDSLLPPGWPESDTPEVREK